MMETINMNMEKVQSSVYPSKKDLFEVMENELYLCDWGMANKSLCKFYNIDIKRNRSSLLNYRVRNFQLCCQWLSLCEVRKRVNYRIPNSYTLKHIVEEWCGEYVSNGAFIAAVIHLNIPYKRYDDSPNVHVALSSRSKMLRRRGFIKVFPNHGLVIASGDPTDLGLKI